MIRPKLGIYKGRTVPAPQVPYQPQNFSQRSSLVGIDDDQVGDRAALAWPLSSPVAEERRKVSAGLRASWVGESEAD